MNNQVKNYKVTIFGSQYTLVSDQSESLIHKAAEHIDGLMTAIAHEHQSTDGQKIAILAAVMCAHELLVLKDHHESNQARVNTLVHKIDHDINLLSQLG